MHLQTHTSPGADHRRPARATLPATTLPAAPHPAGPAVAIRLGAVLLFVLLLTGCREGTGDRAGAAVSVTDLTGRTVALDAPAARVASMMPAVTEWIIAMGAADRLVARTDYDHHPALDSLPSVGGGLTPSIEWLAARQPDLVVAWPDAPSRSVVGRLEEIGIAVYTAPAESIEDALTVARDLGTLLGRRAAADSAVAAVQAGLDSLRTTAAGREPPSVLFLIGIDPLMAAGPGTFLDQLVRAAGGRNALADVDILWPQISLEEVVRRAPGVVLVGSSAAADPAEPLGRRPGWRSVPAVRRGAVYTVDPDRVNRPGPHLHQAAALLACLIHAEPAAAARCSMLDG